MSPARPAGPTVRTVPPGTTRTGAPDDTCDRGVETAVARAVAAAGKRAVSVIGGADLDRQLLAAGLVDELRVDVVPVLLGDGLRLFEGTGRVALEKLGVDEVEVRTSLRFRVVRP